MTNREQTESLLLRVLYMIIVWLLLRVANWAIFVLAVVNYFYRWTSQGEPAPVLSRWGNRLANWMQTATGFLTSVHEDKPWPFRDWRDD